DTASAQSFATATLPSNSTAPVATSGAPAASFSVRLPEGDHRTGSCPALAKYAAMPKAIDPDPRIAMRMTFLPVFSVCGNCRPGLHVFGRQRGGEFHLLHGDGGGKVGELQPVDEVLVHLVV